MQEAELKMFWTCQKEYLHLSIYIKIWMYVIIKQQY